MAYTNHLEMNEMIKEIIQLMPSLNFFFLNDEDLESYSRRVNEYHPDQVYLQRQEIFKRLIFKKIERLFSADEIQKLRLNLSREQGLVAGVVDHHGLLNHPLILSVHLVSNYYKLFNRRTEGDILTFSTGNVPFQNPFNPRGVLFRGKNLHLFPKSFKNSFVFTQRKLEFNFISQLKASGEWFKLEKKDQGFLTRIDGIIRNINFDSCDFYEEQVTKINFYLWPLLFDESLRMVLANLLVLDYDDIILHYLEHIFRNEQESFLYRILFDDRLRKKVLKDFEGVNGAWDSKRGIGTHFFWGFTEEGKQVRLKLVDHQFIGEGSSFSLPLDAGMMIEQMRQRKILPGMVYKFMIILFYMGMKPMAGYSLEYLSRMKERMVASMKEEFPKEVERMKTIPLDNMNLISICKNRNPSGALEDISAFDIMADGGLSKEYLERISSIPFKNFFIPTLPFTYNYAHNKYGNGQPKKSFSIPTDVLQRPFEGLL